MATRLFVRKIESVGAVEDGDNPPAEILLYKRKDAADPLQDPSKVSKITNKSPDRAKLKTEHDMEMPDLSALDDAVREEIEKALSDRDDQIADLKVELEDAEAVTKDDDDDVIKGLSDEAQERFAALEKSNKEQSEALAKERDARLTVEWIGKARAFEKTLGDAEVAGPHLKTLTDTDSADWLLEKFASIEAVLEKSDLFKELGKADGGSAADQIEALAKKAKEDNADLTDAQARALVRSANPDLKAAEREESK